MTTPPIKRVQQGTNAELIATAQTLYPMDGDRVLDLTPGTKLGFWTKYRPPGLRTLDAGLDFRATGMSRTFDHVVFDPPYVTKGGHATSTIGEMNDRYGMLHVEKDPMAQWNRQILPGVDEARRLLERKGLLWFKCMDYVTSGRVFWFTKMALESLELRGFKLVDEFILDGNCGPQPTVNRDGSPRRQVHARNAHSVLMIARKK